MNIPNLMLTFVVAVAVISTIVYLLKKNKNEVVEQQVDVDDKTYTLEKIIKFVKKRLDEITKINLYDIGLSEEELKRRKSKKYELKKALKGCTYGDVNDKKYVKELIYDLLSKEYGVDETNISRIIPFDTPSLLTAQDKFEILIHEYKKYFSYEALTEIIKKYNLAVLKYISGESKPCYVITPEEIDNIYEQEKLEISFADKLEIVVQRIYQQYKGFSSIDEVRDMNIDGVSGGVSGLPESFLSQVAQTDGDYLKQAMDAKVPRACDSIWIFFQGKSIRLAFLSFGTEAELKRVCQNIYKYNNPGQLSDTNGYKINEMKDGSRVVVVRPSMSETWAFFVRKFDVKRATLEQIVKFDGKEETIELLKYLVKGARIIALTGEQGCGKTTMLMAMIENIYETMNLRITETAFELHLRKIYPTRNILSMRETETISGQECLDVQKKTDGSVNIIGEVATDPVASWMIQSAQVASKFTLFTHHAKTFPNLVTALRNSMLRAGTFKDEKTAEEQVVQVLNFNIHLVKDFRGRRYIERITECIPVEEKNEYTFDHRKEKTLEGKLTKFMDNATIFFSKTTNKELYKYRNILEFSDDSYILVNPISEANIREMRNNMEENDLVSFDAFLERNWGIKPPKMPTAAAEELEVAEPKQETPKIAKEDIKENLVEQMESLVDTKETDLLDAIDSLDDLEDDIYPKISIEETEEIKPTAPAKPASKPTSGISKGDVQSKIRKTVGIKRPAGEAPAQKPTQTTTQKPAQRPTQRPVQKTVDSTAKKIERTTPSGSNSQNIETPKNRPTTSSILGGIDLNDEE